MEKRLLCFRTLTVVKQARRRETPSVWQYFIVHRFEKYNFYEISFVKFKQF
jgi:hypothetical protein